MSAGPPVYFFLHLSLADLILTAVPVGRWSPVNCPRLGITLIFPKNTQQEFCKYWELSHYRCSLTQNHICSRRKNGRDSASNDCSILPTVERSARDGPEPHKVSVKWILACLFKAHPCSLCGAASTFIAWKTQEKQHLIVTVTRRRPLNVAADPSLGHVVPVCARAAFAFSTHQSNKSIEFDIWRHRRRLVVAATCTCIKIVIHYVFFCWSVFYRRLLT